MREKLKKLLSLALVVMMVAGLVQVPAKEVKAANEPTFSVRFTDAAGNEITNAKPGDSVKLILSAENAEALTTFKVKVTYDEDKLVEKGGNFTSDFKSYRSSIDEDEFTRIGECNMDIVDGTGGFVVVWAVAQNGGVEALPPSMGSSIDVAYADLKVADTFKGEVLVNTFFEAYVENCGDVITVNKTTNEAATLTVELPKVPMTGFELNKSKLAFDLSSDAKSETLSIASYLPEDTTDKKNEVKWSSSDKEVATVSADGTVTAVGKGTAVITATIENANGTAISRTCEVTVGKSVTAVVINPERITLKNGQTKQLTANVLPNDADNTEVTWSSSDDKVATVDSEGLVTAVAENGTATITATTANGKSGTCAVTVATRHLDSIQLNKNAMTIGRGNTEQLKVTYNPDLANVTDEVSKVTWSSDKEEVATVSADGTVTAVGKGTAVITATVKADDKVLTESCEVTVNVPLKGISVDDADKNISLLKGENKVVNVNLNPSDADADAYDLEWSINSTSASIQPKADKKSCTITALAEGKAIVTVKDKISGKSASIEVTVKEIPITEIQVNVDKKTLNKGETVKAKAVILPEDTTDDKAVTWASSNENVATVDKDGNITAVAGGKTVISAISTEREVSGTVIISVVVPLESIAIVGEGNLNLVKKQTAELEVLYTPEDTTVDKTKLTWKSTDDKIATVDENGVVTAKKAGQVTITAELDGKTATRTVNVTEISLDEIALSDENKTVDLKDESFTLKLLYNKDTTDEIISKVWESSNKEAATVDENGKVSLVGAGETVIKVIVTTDAGTTFTAECKVKVVIPMTGLQVMKDEDTVTGKTLELKKGASMVLVAVADPTNTTDVIDKIEWKSSDAESVAVDENGVVTTLKESAEPVTITATATLTTGEKFKASVKVSAVEIHITSIKLSEDKMTLEAGQSASLTVTYLPENTTDAKVIKTWSSSNPEVAVVDANGIIAAVKGGTAVITATTANGKKAECTINVPIHIDRITANNIEMKLGDKPKAITAKVFPENTSDDKTMSYEIADGEDVIELSADGKVTAFKEGTAHVTVTAVNAYGDVKPSTTITVTVTEQHLTFEDLGFTEDTAGIDDVDENNIHQVRIDAKNPHIEVVCDDQVTDTVYVSYAVKEGSDTILSIDEDGNLTFMQPGVGVILITITAEAADGRETYRETFEYALNVYEVFLEGIEFAKDSQDVTMTEGTEKTFTVIFNPEDATDKYLTWESSDPTIATVTEGTDGKAVVKALKPGKVTIKAISGSGLEAVTTVTVVEKSTIVIDDGNKNNPNGTENSGVPKTGDIAQPVLFGIGLITALFVIFVVLKRKLKRTV